VARSLQDGAAYAAKVLPKALKKSKAQQQLQSESGGERFRMRACCLMQTLALVFCSNRSSNANRQLPLGCVSAQQWSGLRSH
jgi:hypothetical protein